MKRLFLALYLQIFSSFLLAQTTEILMWHSFAGPLGEELQELVQGFNTTQNDYRIKLLYKGEYTDSLTSFAAAFRAKEPPDIIQVFEVGTAAMLSPKGIIKPAEELLKENGLLINLSRFFPAIRDFYSQEQQLQAMPFNTSVPVIFYNADLLSQVGVKGPQDFPKTWQQLEVLAKQLKKKGAACVYTSAYSAWIHVESFSALHGLDLFNADQSKVAYNTKAIRQHLARLKRWQSLHYFEYGGRANDASVLFTSGRCAMFSQSSGGHNALNALVNFKLSAAPMPIDEGLTKTRHNNIVGGAALWALSGLSAQKYRGIGHFYQYIAQDAIQFQWYQHTGYVPLSLPKNSAELKENSPTLAIARFDLSREAEKPVFLNKVPQNQIRAINDEALEALFSGIQTPEEALAEAERQANFALKRFAQNNFTTNKPSS